MKKTRHEQQFRDLCSAASVTGVMGYNTGKERLGARGSVAFGVVSRGFAVCT